MNAATRSALASIWAAVHSSPSSLPFPEVIAQLTALGVSRYRVDYITRTITAYTPSNPPQAHTTPFPEAFEYEFGPWDMVGIMLAIRGALGGGEGGYSAFSKAVVGSGVVECTVYVGGRKVVYGGSEGEGHTEWFPGAGAGDG
ncbi:Nn.00g013290.m01.CDS01 [Neocucurbitaria sp. VM-36]